METARPFGEFARYTFLSVLGMIALSCYILADTFFVSRSLGTNGLAALNLAIPVYNFIHGTGLMLGMGGATRFSILKSRGESHAADVVYTNTLYFSALFSLLFMAAGLFLAAPLTALLGADEATFQMSCTYLNVLLLFSPAFILNDVFLCFVRNDGNPRLAMIATVVSSLSNVVLDYVFMFPFGMGIFGAVLATGLSPAIGVAIMAPHWMGTSKGFRLTKTGVQADAVKFTFALGFPSLLAQLSSGIVMIAFNTIILRLTGNTGVAAYGVVANISLVVTSIYTGIAQGVQPLISREYGRNHRTLQRQYLKFSLISMAALSAAVYAVIFFFADPIAGIFNSEGSFQLQQIAVTGLKLYFTSVVFVGYNTIISTYFTSVEQAVPAHIVSLLRGLILIIPMALILSSLWGMTGVWLAFPATELAVAAIGLFFSAKDRKRG